MSESSPGVEPLTDAVSATDQTAPAGDTQSVLAEVRALRSKLGTGSKPFDVDVPGYNGLVVLRCKWIPFRELSQQTKDLANIKEPSEAEVAAATDLLILSCQEVLIRVEGVIKPLSQTDQPITFSDPRLLENLGAPPATTARAAVISAFGGNDYALLETANKVLDWLKDTSKELDQAHLGN